MVDQKEVHRKARSDKVEDRIDAVGQLRASFADLPDKPAAWEDMIRLTGDEDHSVRWGAAYALGAAFPYVPDKTAAWSDLHRLTCDEDNSVRWGAAGALGVAFPYISDNESAWIDLHRLTDDENTGVRVEAAYELGLVFSHIPDKAAAWADLIWLASGVDLDVGRWAAVALGSAFFYVPDKESAWKDLHMLTLGENGFVRHDAAVALGTAFPYVPDKPAAWEDLHRLTSDEDSNVRERAANALGAAFSHVPDKTTAWKDLLDLAKDSDRDVRVSVNHSLGRVSILKATEAEREEGFREELENALEFFERSVAEARYSNPSKFCLPFYRSFYVLIFKKENAEAEVQRYLSEAKNVSEGSKSKEDLLEAVENLANALRESLDLREKSLVAVKRDLNVYRRYCDRAAELLDDSEEKAPGATKVIRRGLPVIDHRIKETIAEIQEMSRELCKLTRGTPIEPRGAEFYREAGELSDENDLKCGRSIFRMAELLEDMCELVHSKRREHARDLIKDIYNYSTLGDQINRLETAMSYIQPNVDIERYGRQFEDIRSKLGEIKRNTVNISRNLVDLQENIFNQLDQNEKTIIATIIDQNDRDQLQEILDLVKQVLSKLQNQEIALRGSLTPGDVDQLSKVVDDIKLNTTDKLIFTMPIIPYVLKYEHGIALDKGMNLSAAWKQLVSRARRHR